VLDVQPRCDVEDLAVMDMLLKGVLIMLVLDPDTGRGIKDLKNRHADHRCVVCAHVFYPKSFCTCSTPIPIAGAERLAETPTTERGKRNH
jgi:hypothetical protein